MSEIDIPKFEINSYPDHIFLPKGMISTSEAKLLYFIAKNMISLEGEIVDAGSFVGASTYALAAGLKDNPNTEKNIKIFSYDIFKANEKYLIQYLQNNFFVNRDKTGRKISELMVVKEGYDYYEIYRFQTQRYSGLIVTVKGDIITKKWNGYPIELLFLDVCKTVEINSHIFKEFFPYLIPGKSIIVQQDYHHIYHPYIHITMQAIKDYCTCILTKVSASRVYRLEREIPNNLLKKIVDYNFTFIEKYELLKSIIYEAKENEKPLLHVVLARELFVNKKYQALKSEIKIILSSYDADGNKALWLAELKIGCPGFVDS